MLLSAPIDATVNVSRGFHNAPKLYGDTTVRKQQSITGFQSGIKAAGEVSDISAQLTARSSLSNENRRSWH